MSSASTPLVSIGVPVKDGAETLRMAVDSLLAQDHPNLEVVVSDNASEDATPEICRDYAARDPRFRWSRSEQRLPLYVNWQRTVEISRGDAFAWCAADDVRPAGSIRALGEALQARPDAVFAHGPIRVEVLRTGDVVEVSHRGLGSGDLETRVRGYASSLRHPALMHALFRRSALARLPLLTEPAQSWKAGPYGQDYLFGLRALTLGEAVWVSAPMLHYRDRFWKRPVIQDPIATRIHWDLRGLIHADEIDRRKCHGILRLGRAAILAAPGVSPEESRRAAAAFSRAFVLRHGGALLRESALELVWRTTETVALRGAAERGR
jgi:glycosyltransferase involved in cell wall biosynthesis